MVGTYDLIFDQKLSIEEQDGKLIYNGRLMLWSDKTQGELVHVGNGKYAADGYANLLSIEVLGDKKRIVVSREGSDEISYFPMSSAPK